VSLGEGLGSVHTFARSLSLDPCDHERSFLQGEDQGRGVEVLDSWTSRVEKESEVDDGHGYAFAFLIGTTRRGDRPLTKKTL
jgi:hypothetical protein